jgi:phage shock protein A
MNPARRALARFFPTDPTDLLKRNIRELEDQVPLLNESLALLKAQVTLVEKEIQRLREREATLQAKVADALAGGREDVASNYRETLGEVRRELAAQERQLEPAQRTFACAQAAKRAFMFEKEQTIHAAKEALSARRQTDWNRRVLEALLSCAHASGDAGGDQRALVRRIKDEAAESQALLDRTLRRFASAEPLDLDGLRRVVGSLDEQVQDLEQRLRETQELARIVGRRLAELED